MTDVTQTLDLNGIVDREAVAMIAIAFGGIVLLACRGLLWRSRVKVAILIVLGAGYWRLQLTYGPQGAAGIEALIVAALLLATLPQRTLLHPAGVMLWRLLHAEHARAKWSESVEAVGIAHPFPVRRVRHIASGDLLSISVPRGYSLGALEAKQRELKTALRVRDVRIEEDNGHQGSVLLVRRDPFEDPTPVPWPNRDANRLSVWDPIPWGVDERGTTVTIRLPEANLLIGGATRGGKSRGLALAAATAALDPDCDLWCLDHKEVELSQWTPLARRFAGASGKDAIALLEDLTGVLREQYDALKAARKKKIGPGEYRPQVLLCDEIARYLELPDRDQANRIMDLWNGIAAMGLAAGVISVHATQKPAANLHPRFTQLRDNLLNRIAYRTLSREASTMILGPDAQAAGIYASDAKALSQPGVCFYCVDGYLPIRVRTFLLTDDEEAAIIARGIGGRFDAEWATLDATAAQEIHETSTRLPVLDAPPPAPPTTRADTAQTEKADAGNAAKRRAAQDRAKLLALFADGRVWTRAQLCEADGMGAAQRQWGPVLEGLVTEGLVRRWTAKPGAARKGNPWLFAAQDGAESGSAQDGADSP